MWVYNVSELHRPRISEAFLADTIHTTRLLFFHTALAFCILY